MFNPFRKRQDNDMKTNKFLLAILGVGVLLFTACKDEIKREESPADTGKYQVYIFAEEAENTSHIFLPSDAVRNVSIKFGRCLTSAAADIPLDIQEKSEGTIIYSDTLHFKAGAAVDSLVFNLDNVDAGKSYSVVVTIPEQYASLYGMTSITLKLGADYTWITAGTADFNQDFLTQDACKVNIQYAKEYVPDDPKHKLYRLESPFYQAMLVTYPDEVEAFCDPDAHIQFLLDTVENYDIVKFVPLGWNANFSNTGWDGGYIGAGTGPLIWAASDAAMSAYGGGFSRSDNKYEVSTVVFSSGSGSGWYFKFDWTWTEGFPGIISNPLAGDGATDTLYFDDPYTIYPEHDVAPVYWINEDFEETGTHPYYDIYTTNGDGVGLRIALTADTIIGTFTFANVNYPTNFDESHWTTEFYNIGNFVAFPGFWSTADDYQDGSYLELPTPYAVHYLRTGTVKIEVDEENPGFLKATVNAYTSNGIEFNCILTNIDVDGIDFNPSSPSPARRGHRKAVKFTGKTPEVDMINF